MRPVGPWPGRLMPSYSSWAALIARCAPMLRRLLAACWKVLVVNGGAGDLVRVPFFTLLTENCERRNVSTRSSADAASVMDGPASRKGGFIDVPAAAAGNRASSASNVRPAFESCAWMVQYSTG